MGSVSVVDYGRQQHEKTLICSGNRTKYYVAPLELASSPIPYPQLALVGYFMAARFAGWTKSKKPRHFAGAFKTGSKRSVLELNFRRQLQLP